MANTRRGLLQAATEINHQAKVDTSEIRLPSTGMQEAMAGVSREFAQIGQRIGQMADHAAAREGHEQGRLDGLDPEFRPTRAMTIRGEAYDKAGLDVYKARMKVEMATDLEEVYAKYGDDPSKLAQAYNEKRRGWLSNVLPEVRPDMELSFRSATAAGMRQATRAQTTRVTAEQKATLEAELQLSLRGIHQRAYALGLDATADELLAGELQQMGKAMARVGPNGKYLIEPKAAEKLLQEAGRDVATARLLGAFERLPSLEAKEKFIADFNADFAGSRGLAKVYDLDRFRQVGGMLEAELRSARVGQNATRRALEQDIAGVARMAEKGFAPPSDDMAALKARVASANDPELAAALEAGENLMQWQSQARRLTPAELDAWTRGERDRMAKGASSGEVARLELGEKLLTTMRTELGKDPLGWADRVGVLQIAPLDFSSPETAAATLKARVAQADEVATAYGVEPKYLRPDEVRSLAAATAEGGQNAIAIAQAVAGAAPERAQEILGQVFDHAPAVAALGGLVAAGDPTQPPQVAIDAADGMALRRTDGFKALISEGRASREAASGVLGTSLSVLPKSETAVIALANSAYEVRARRQGVTEFDAVVYGQALREVLGEQTVAGVKYGGLYHQDRGLFGGPAGSPIVIPPDVRQDKFKDLIETIRAEDLIDPFGGRPESGDGKPLTMATLRRAKLVTIGQGRYMMALGSDLQNDPQYVVRGGEPYVLDLNALSGTLRRRRPDLYVGAAR